MCVCVVCVQVVLLPNLILDVHASGTDSLELLDRAGHVEHAPEARVGVHQKRQLAHPAVPTKLSSRKN
jgi:hypothetical protein